ncbi:MAG TPA: glycosyltransferase family 4 protein [Candidatus Bathyarchaeia archaeon]|nr:glycosyltransferase family 4 protein [Candidatus Bathyarchaeia archaeon]
MNILVLAARDRRNKNFAGGDLTLTEVSQRLSAMGHSVTYICSRFRKAPREQHLENVRILRLGNVWTTALWMLLFYLRNRQKFDVVIEEVIGGLRIPYFAPLYVHKPLVGVWYQRNEMIFRFQYNKITANVLKLLEYSLARLHRSRLLLCPSKRTIADISKLGIPLTQFRVYTPGIDSTILNRSGRALTSRREDLIVWLGKIRKYKRTEDAMFTMDRLVKMVPSSRMLIVGIPEDQKYFNYLQGLRHRLDLAEKVHFKFGVTEEEKGDLLLRTKAILVTSPMEGFGNVVSEANACGAPAVVTTGIPEDVVSQGLNGFRVNFGDIEGMADACRNMLTDSPMFDKMSRAAIECAQRRNWDQTAESFLAAVTEATKSSLARMAPHHLDG